MTLQNLKLPHDYFIIASKSYIAYLDKIFAPFAGHVNKLVPIIIKNTGDEVFLTNMYGKSAKTSKELYEYVPRIDLDVKGITLIGDEMTNPMNMGHMTLKDDEDYSRTRVHEVRRLPIEFTYEAEIKFNNIIEYLHFIDILLTVSYHDHSFKFYYLGQEYTGTFTIPVDFDGTANLELAYSTDKRHRVLPLVFVLQLQFPAFNFYNVGSGAPGNDSWEGFGQTETMQKLIHNMHVNDESKEGIISTITIPDNPLTQ